MGKELFHTLHRLHRGGMFAEQCVFHLPILLDLLIGKLAQEEPEDLFTLSPLKDEVQLNFGHFPAESGVEPAPCFTVRRVAVYQYAVHVKDDAVQSQPLMPPNSRASTAGPNDNSRLYRYPSRSRPTDKPASVRPSSVASETLYPPGFCWEYPQKWRS